MKYESVIWDWNGTLLDDVVLAVEIVNDLFQEHGVPRLTTDQYRELFDFPVTLYYERAGLDSNRHDFNLISERFCDRFEKEFHRVSLFSPALETLRSVRQSGMRQYLLSGTEHHALHRMAARSHALNLFDAAQGLHDNQAAGKHDAARNLIEQYQLKPEKTIMIGDTTHDADVARHLGLDCILLSAGHHSRSRLIQKDFPVFDSLSALSAPLQLVR
jgi:phosphoglycolate phosphatase